MKSLTIGTKFRAGFLALVSLTLILGISSVFALRSMNQTFDDAVQITARKIQLSGDINAMEGDLFLAQRAVVLAAFVKDPERTRAAKREFEEGTAKLKEGLGAIVPMLSTPEEQRLEQVMQADLDQWLAVYTEVAHSADSGNPTKANLISYQQVRPIYQDFEDAAYKLSSTSQQLMAADQKAAADKYAKDSWLAVALVVLSLLVGAAIFFVTNQVTAQLRRVTLDITSGADQVASASGQIATGSQTLSQGASQQASAVEEISASMEQMTAMTRSSGANSSEAMAMMVQTALQVERSNAALAEMLASMSSIKSSSERVAKINKTIDEIAFQTNILALNAAVEAARAGEAGKGFAVVADEVRNLAQRAAAAAKDTAALIEESIANSNQGAQKLELVSAAIHGITEGAQKVKRLVGEVNDAGQQQVQGIQQVSIAIEQVNKVTQSNASNSEESAAAAQELNAQSLTVRELVNKLRRMVDGGEDHSVRRIAQGAGTRGSGSSIFKSAGRAGTDDTFSMEAEEAGSFRGF